MGSGARIALVAALAVLLGGALVPAASGKGLRYVTSKAKDLPAGKIRGTAAKCPDGSAVVGGGVSIKGANTATGIHSSYPFDDGDSDSKPDGWRGVANSRSAGDKSLKVSAVCSTTGKYTYSTGTTSAADGMHTEMYAYCPPAQSMIGGGVELSKGNASLIVGGSYPADTDADTVPDDYWYGIANNESGAPQTIRTHAVCAKSGSYEYVEAGSTASSFAQGVATAPCPAGTKVVAGGGTSDTSTTSAEIAQTGPYSTGGPGATPDDGWRTYVNNLAGVPLDISAFAICRD